MFVNPEAGHVELCRECMDNGVVMTPSASNNEASNALVSLAKHGVIFRDCVTKQALRLIFEQDSDAIADFSLATHATSAKDGTITSLESLKTNMASTSDRHSDIVLITLETAGDLGEPVKDVAVLVAVGGRVEPVFMHLAEIVEGVYEHRALASSLGRGATSPCDPELRPRIY